MFSTEAAPETYTGIAIFDAVYSLYGVALRKAFVRPHGCATVRPVFSVERLAQSEVVYVHVPHPFQEVLNLVTKSTEKKRLKVHYAG